MSANIKTFIRTHTGLDFNYATITNNVISIVDIAHALSNICRFAGHVDEFYSVAQHSVLVSELCDEDDALAGLLHDCHEAYVIDMPSPLKRMLPSYKALENDVQKHVLAQFGLSPKLPSSVKRADMVALATEGRELFSNGWPYEKLIGVTPAKGAIIPLNPHQARRLFLRRAKQLLGEKLK